jgi:hypothetical protein
LLCDLQELSILLFRLLYFYPKASTPYLCRFAFQAQSDFRPECFLSFILCVCSQCFSPSFMPRHSRSTKEVLVEPGGGRDPDADVSLVAISQDLLNEFSFFEQYSAAAYCPENNVATSDANITCDADNCPLVQSAGAESILEFQKYSPPNLCSGASSNAD